MPAGSTYTPIATTTLGSAVSSYTFTSIPSTYTDLVLIANYATSSNAAESVYVQFNSDSGSNYSSTDLIGDGSSATSGRTTSASYIRIGGRAVGTSSTANISITHFQNYANTTTYKTLLNRFGAAALGTVATVGLWRNTAAITSITVAGNSQNLSTGSTFTLYGIASA
jgi:hypothetical protein